MNVYEKRIADEINQIANKEIFFNANEIMREPDGLATEIIGKLVSWACKPTNTTPITIARECLKQFPTDWISNKIKQTVLSSIDIGDYWEYRRLLELSEIISIDLLEWVITLGEGAKDLDIIEAVDDFTEILQSLKKHNI